MAEKSFLQALRGGAVGFVSRLIEAATHPFVIINRIRQAYRGMNMGEVSQVYWLGAQAHTAAYEIGATGGSGIASLGDIPINPQLFPGGSFGNRFKFSYTASFTVPGETEPRYRTINASSPDNLTLFDLQSDWDSRMAGYISSLRDTDQRPFAAPPVSGGIVQVNYIERLF